MVHSFPGLSPMRNASAKRNIKSNPFTNNPQVQTEDVIYNPKNPENPDSKPSVAGKFILKPIGEKTRGIASLQKNGIKSNPL
jgi:hypothetical protein